MKKKLLITLILLPFLVSSKYTMAGPFGMEMGMPLNQAKEELNLKPTKAPGVYQTSKLIKNHHDFDDFSLIFTPETGLCKIIAWSVPIKSSVYGEGITSFFETITTSLEEKYGKAKKYDYLKAGSIWNEPKDWMMSLIKKERTLFAAWTTDGHPLPENLQAIAVEVKAFSRDSGIAILTYEFNNITKCTESRKTNLNNAL